MSCLPRVDLQPIIAFRTQLPPLTEDAVEATIQVASYGEYKGHPAGPFEFSPEVFAQIKANFDRDKMPLPLTYDHPKYGLGNPVRKAGRIIDLDIRQDGLYAVCEFTREAVELNRNGSYRYCSVVIIPESFDRASNEPIGCELLEVALTDSPFIPNLREVRLSRDSEHLMEAIRELGPDKPISSYLKRAVHILSRADLTEVSIQTNMKAVKLMKDSEFLAQAIKELGPDKPMSSYEELACALKRAEELKSGKAEEPAIEEAPAPEAALAVEPPVEMPMADVPASPEGEGAAGADAQAANLIEEVSGMDLVSALAILESKKDALAALFQEAPAEGTPADTQGLFSHTELEALRGSNLQLSRRVNELEVAIAATSKAKADAERATLKASVEAKVAEIVKAGRLLDTDAPKWVALGMEAPERFNDLVSTMTQVVPTGTLVLPGAPEERQATARGADEELLIKALKKANVKNIDAAVQLHRSRQGN